MKHAITFDVEEYFHVVAFADSVAASDWSNMQSRLEPAVELTLGILAERGIKGTFFTLGWVAEHHPLIVRRIAEAGHEIACHSNAHKQVFSLTPEQFRDDTNRAKDLLEQVSGVSVIGYRAPSFSIVKQSMWALDILAELGFRYDSSIFPVRHLDYGVISAPRDPFVINTSCGPIVEFPMPCLKLGNHRAPFGGGAYLRLLPYWYTTWAFRQYERETGHGGIVYAHPWEFDPCQAHMKGRLTSRLRHYVGLRGVERKLRRLLHDFHFTSLDSLLPEVISAPGRIHTATAIAG